jgi:hypothetical protein
VHDEQDNDLGRGWGVLDEAEYLQLTALGIAAAVNAGALSAVEVLDAAWGRLARVEPRLRAFTHLWADQARARATGIDRARARGARLVLAGVPIGVKATEGIESVQAQRLLAAGCVPIGSTSAKSQLATAEHNQALSQQTANGPSFGTPTVSVNGKVIPVLTQAGSAQFDQLSWPPVASSGRRTRTEFTAAWRSLVAAITAANSGVQIGGQ